MLKHVLRGHYSGLDWEWDYHAGPFLTRRRAINTARESRTTAKLFVAKMTDEIVTTCKVHPLEA